MSFLQRNFLTDTQVREIICESRSTNTIAHYATDVESGFEIPCQVGKGAWKQIALREGLSLGVLDVVKRQTHQHLLKPRITATLSSLFYLAGRSQLTLHSTKTNWMNVANHSYAAYLPEETGIEEYPPSERIQIVQLSINVNLFREFCCHQIHSLPLNFQSITDSTQQPFLFQFGIITPAIRTTLQQVLECPYAGFVKQLYLEGKALELLALQFQQAIEQVEPKYQPALLLLADVERIHAAREILRDRIHHPPGLVELARLVGLNDFKLKQGFKQVYGTTVFGYVYECRMQRAQQLLQTKEMNIEEVARAVGYATRSSFAVAFRRKFGINPKSYLG
jgi:AraC-like DNA-binding protein